MTPEERALKQWKWFVWHFYLGPLLILNAIGYTAVLVKWLLGY